MYKELDKELLAGLPDGHLLVPGNDAVRFGRLVQLACSAIEVADGEDRDGFTAEQVKLVSPSNKADALLEFLGGNDGQWIVWRPGVESTGAPRGVENQVP